MKNKSRQEIPDQLISKSLIKDELSHFIENPV